MFVEYSLLISTGKGIKVQRGVSFLSHLEVNYKEMQLLLREVCGKVEEGFGSSHWNSDLVFNDLQSCHKLGNQ